MVDVTRGLSLQKHRVGCIPMGKGSFSLKNEGMIFSCTNKIPARLMGNSQDILALIRGSVRFSVISRLYCKGVHRFLSSLSKIQVWFLCLGDYGY